jgi:lysophospholipase L1-like esterase
MHTESLRKPPRRLFQAAAILIPSTLGIAALVGLMTYQERLVIDWSRLSVRMQTPPIYVEEPTHEITGYRYLFDEELGWRNIPGWTASTAGKKLTINSKGLRDREYAYEKPDGTRRILVLGDSFTWGYGVENDAIFTEVLERRFAKEDQPWEVINSGVSGWGTDQEYLWFRREGIKYRPDLVIVAFYILNDPYNNIGSVQYGLGKPVFTDTNLNGLNPPRLNPGPLKEEVPGLSPLQMSAALLGAIARSCESIGARLVVMKFGLHGTRPDPATLAFDRALAASIQSRPGVLFLDLDQECDARGHSFFKMIEGNDDGHWNAYGHKLVGEMLHEFLSKRIPEPTPKGNPEAGFKGPGA